MTSVEGFCVLLFMSLMMLTKIEVLSNKLTDLYRLVEKTGIEEKTYIDGQTKNTIIIKDKEYEIYMYFSADEPSSNGYRKLSMLYTCINCVFAEWIRDEMFKLLKCHSTVLPKVLSVPLNRIRQPKTIFDQPQMYVNRFINILLNFTSIYLNEYDTTLNTDVLRSLLSVSFKINYMNISNSLYSPLILGEINSIQRFLLLNCKLPPYFEKEFHGLLFDKYTCPKTENVNDNIDAFIENIRPLKLESQNVCNIKQITLQDMIPKTFGNIEWTTEYGTVTITTVLQRIKQTFDLDVIFWYQKFFFNTILKILLTKIIDYLNLEPRLPLTILEVIQEFHSSILPSVSNMPPALKKCFSILIEDKVHINSNRDEVVKIFSEHIHSLDIIRLNDYVNSHKKSDKSFHNVNEHLKDLQISTLYYFTQYLNATMADFKCFIRLFEFLSHENDSYHVSFLEKSEKIKVFLKELTKGPNNNIRVSEELKKQRELFIHKQGCVYFRGLYNYSDSAIQYLYEAQDTQIDVDTKEKYLAETKSNLEIVAKLLNDFMKDYWYISYFKILYNVLPLVELTLGEVTERLDIPKRLLMAVMTELNAYSIEFCDKPAYTTLSFGKINKKSKEIYEETKKSMLALEKEYTNTTYCNYLSVLVLIKIFNDPLDVFVKYKNVINLYWRGTKTNIENIHKSIRFSVSSPYDIYLMYDIYMKFSIAALYYEIHKMLDSDIEIVVIKENYDTCLKTLGDRFSVMFRPILTLIDEYTRSYNLMMHNPVMKDKTVKQIIIQFTKIGVFLDLSPMALDGIREMETNSNDDKLSAKNDQNMTSSYVEDFNDMRVRCSMDFAQILGFMEKVNQSFLMSCVSEVEIVNLVV